MCNTDIIRELGKIADELTEIRLILEDGLTIIVDDKVCITNEETDPLIIRKEDVDP